MKGLSVEDVLQRMMHATSSRNQAELANRLGVRRAAVTDAKRRETVPPDWYMRLARMHQANPVWLETGLGPEHIGGGDPEDFALVPKVGAVARMGPEGLETSGDVEGFYAFRRDFLTRLSTAGPESLKLMGVAGDSMEPTLRDGDVVLVDESVTEPVYGRIHVVGIDDGIVLKRLDKRPGGLVLLSDNRDLYPPIEIDESDAEHVRLIGRVVWMARELH
jgi:SOS-response transcriptional repressor LexA